MTTHTPGPWKIVTDNKGDPRHVVGDVYTTVASFLTSVKSCCGPEEIGANAVLISAAPDLLDALDTLLNRIELEGCTPLDWPSFRAGRAAIKKATGATA